MAVDASDVAVGACLANEFLLPLTTMICTSVFSVFSATEKWTSEGRVGDKFPSEVHFSVAENTENTEVQIIVVRDSKNSFTKQTSSPKTQLTLR